MSGPDVSDIAQLIDLSGRRALVTGGGKGTGAAIAARLLEAGAGVTIADRDPDGAETASSLSMSGLSSVRPGKRHLWCRSWPHS